MSGLPAAGRRRCLRTALGLGVALGLGAGVAQAAAASLPDVIAAVRPAVLPVGVFDPTASPRFAFRGTGFVVGDGTLVATNFHVLPEGADTAEPGTGPRMMVMLGRVGDTGVGRAARVVATDRLRDLALLRVEGAPLPALALAPAGSAREGQAIALMGFPVGGTLGFAPVTHAGIVASITTAALPAPSAARLDPRALVRLRQGNFELLQLDATAYPGNSGGPVFDAATGQVLGIVNMVLVKAGRESALANPTGISYAVPVAALHELLAELR